MKNFIEIYRHKNLQNDFMKLFTIYTYLCL